ncbi:Uma2 family endonuclease [Pseudanabaena sp. PCC 6802]|uniref:Uma2 family endonuclease n=1 Tax=Pseudanabaena sp. PCC 6802 TaxID=118173 RepID=UPI0003484B42|nr:Uma2 family endonuclease [Pseudanabaena sp. PCC 6802]
MYQQHPRSPAESMPTMYDLPSEDPEEPGLPDEFHDFQPKLLRETCKPIAYPPEEVFIGADLNLYYDGRHPQWYKRPDWFLVLGVTAGDRVENLRWSYVVWQESVNPFVVVELLSPGTEDEDLGSKVREIGKPPLKWEVYERILRVPFYVVFDRYEQQLRIFVLEQARYRSVELDELRYWFEPLELGLGVWAGRYQGIEGQWLRWYDRSGNWIPTDAERSEQAEQQVREEAQARQQAERQLQEETQARQQAERQAIAEAQARREAIPRLSALGLTSAQIAEALGLTVAEVEAF